MNNTDKEIINEYENYLIRVKIDTNNIYDSIKKLDDVKKYESIVKLELEKYLLISLTALSRIFSSFNILKILFLSSPPLLELE